MKELNGKDIVDFIKMRQLHVSRSLRQASHATPKLVIIRTNPDPVVDTYLKLKKSYGEDLEAEVEVVELAQKDAIATINKLNKDKSVFGIIVQLPLADKKDTLEILAAVDPAKDVDGLTPNSKFTPPTVTAIDWLLAGHNVNLLGKKIVIVGKGRLVGAPLEKHWKTAELDVSSVDDTVKDLGAELKTADVIVSAVGQPGLIRSSMVKKDAILVDAGVSAGKNGLLGDVDDEVRKRSDVRITPKVGGVGPLTIAALFENLLFSTGVSVKKSTTEQHS
ncbi:MAG: bifunctional 5,10-methylenetetrahydrofolate dehydrogenase/5,10-methenyltetrahydrofolate cyclohydrolase [Patescibacteria group bacterium]